MSIGIHMNHISLRRRSKNHFLTNVKEDQTHLIPSFCSAEGDALGLRVIQVLYRTGHSGATAAVYEGVTENPTLSGSPSAQNIFRTHFSAERHSHPAPVRSSTSTPADAIPYTPTGMPENDTSTTQLSKLRRDYFYNLYLTCKFLR